jgi:hypothetical protein
MWLAGFLVVRIDQASHESGDMVRIVFPNFPGPMFIDPT